MWLQVPASLSSLTHIKYAFQPEHNNFSLYLNNGHGSPQWSGNAVKTTITVTGNPRTHELIKCIQLYIQIMKNCEVYAMPLVCHKPPPPDIILVPHALLTSLPPLSEF